MNEFLKNSAEIYRGAVRDFISQLSIYENEEPEFLNDEKVRKSFSKAVDETILWTRQVLLMELMEHPTKNHVIAILKLPDMDREISVNISEYDKESVFDEFENSAEILETPIGCISKYLYEKIVTIKDNPIFLLYNHLYLLVKNIYHMFLMHDGDMVCLPDKKLMEEQHIQDPLSLYRYMGIWKNLDEFLTYNKMK